MPYITQERRDILDICTSDTTKTAGELNYMFTSIALCYINRQGLSYQRLNDIIGALEGAKLELSRRLAAPYEDSKIIQNGDVY